MTPKRMAEIHKSAFLTQRPWSESEFTTLLSAPTTVLACPNDFTFAVAQVIEDEAELLTIATHAAHQRQGHARICLENLIELCAQRDSTKMFLDVDSGNSAALGLYQQFGFTEVGRRRNYYAHPGGKRGDAVVMIKEGLST